MKLIVSPAIPLCKNCLHALTLHTDRKTEGQTFCWMLDGGEMPFLCKCRMAEPVAAC